MMTNNKPWQAIVSSNGQVKIVEPRNLPQAVNKERATTNTVPKVKSKVIHLSRYSFDDNGGGYQGL